MMTDYSALLTQNYLKDLPAVFGENIPPFHIYIIGRRPRITLNPKTFQSDAKKLSGTFFRHSGEEKEEHSFEQVMPPEVGPLRLKTEYPYTKLALIRQDGSRFRTYPAAMFIGMLGHEYRHHLSLEVLYVGQAFGSNGERIAPERLKSHSTLQGIYAEAQQNNPDMDIWITLFSFKMQPLFSIDGTQKEYSTTTEEDDLHRKKVIKSEITEQQQINFTEAALIRYFEPEYNSTYKNTFPNYAHSTYSKCYDLEINTVNIELHTTDLKCALWSKKAKPRDIHFCTFPMYRREDRKAMFETDFKI
jgi:hypothetical protein